MDNGVNGRSSLYASSDKPLLRPILLPNPLRLGGGPLCIPYLGSLVLDQQHSAMARQPTAPNLSRSPTPNTLGSTRRPFYTTDHYYSSYIPTLDTVYNPLHHLSGREKLSLASCTPSGFAWHCYLGVDKISLHYHIYDPSVTHRHPVSPRSTPQGSSPTSCPVWIDHGQRTHYSIVSWSPHPHINDTVVRCNLDDGTT
jgi:hypothetical protein